MLLASWTASTPVKGVRVIIAFNTTRDARKHWYVNTALIQMTHIKKARSVIGAIPVLVAECVATFEVI